LGVRIGIDYAAIAPTAAASGLGFDPSIFADIRSMERAALEAFAKA
jgi:hypothetical protein